MKHIAEQFELSLNMTTINELMTQQTAQRAVELDEALSLIRQLKAKLGPPKLEPGFTLKVLDHGFVRYVDHLGDDERIVAAARVSYHAKSKGPEADKKLLFYLWQNHHTSPFEMVKVTLNIKLPIFIMRQYVRHRMQNLNEVSARYTGLPNEFYMPMTWRRQDPKNKQGSLTGPGGARPAGVPSSFDNGDWDPLLGPGQVSALTLLKHHCEASYSIYQLLLEAGVAREMARMVLPVNVYTEIMATWDLKNLLHYLSLREDQHAQWEHQQYGKAIATICRKLFPWTMEAYDRFKLKVVDEDQEAYKP